MKASTGSGKTIILIDYVDTYLTNVIANTAFIWPCPGKGNLEKQSREKMMKFAPGRVTQNLFDALLNEFTPGSTTFINWGLVTKRGNTAIRDSERKNLFDCIADTLRADVEFIVIIDEEHSNNTAKAKTIIDAFVSKNIVRVSATAIENKRYEFFEIDEVDVIGAGPLLPRLFMSMKAWLTTQKLPMITIICLTLHMQKGKLSLADIRKSVKISLLLCLYSSRTDSQRPLLL